MRLYQFKYQGVYLGGVAFVVAPDDAAARDTLSKFAPKGWPEDSWQRQVALAEVVEVLIPRSPAVIYNYDGDY